MDKYFLYFLQQNAPHFPKHGAQLMVTKTIKKAYQTPVSS